MSWKEELEPFFKPKSFAIIGAPTSTNTAHYFLLGQLKEYTERVYPVNPNHSEVAGVKAYKSVKDVEDAIDFAAIAVSAKVVPQVLEECIEKKVKAGIIYAAGFAEAGRVEEGRQMQTLVSEICERGHLRMCGPNCLGMINNTSGLVVMRAGPMYRGGVALITQSGGFGITVEDRFYQRGIGISHVVSSGNETVLSAADYIGYLVKQPEVKVIGVYMETVNSPQTFLQVANAARDLHKPIVVLRCGKTEAGAKGALSHTGSFSGSYEVFAGIMKQHAVTVANSLDDLVENLAIYSGLAPEPSFAGGSVGYVTPSGGAVALLSDACAQLDFTPAEPSPQAKKEIEGVLPPFTNVTNPLDVAGDRGYNPALYFKCLSTLAKDPAYSLVVYVSPVTSPDKNLVEILSRKNELGKPLVVLTEVVGNIEREAVDVAKDNTILTGFDLGLPALKNLFWYCKKIQSREGALYSGSSRVTDHHITGRGESLEQGFKMLEAYDIPVAKWRTVQDLSELINSAAELGYPLVMKPNSSEILHKSDLGLVIPNIMSDQQLKNEYEKVIRAISSRASDKSILLQSMIQKGTEIAIGSLDDKIFGPAIMLGLGGVFIEALKDYSIRSPPISPEDATEMIGDLKSRDVLKGYRGSAGVDLDELSRILVNFSQLVRDRSDIFKEIDVNPLICTTSGIQAVDVRMIPR